MNLYEWLSSVVGNRMVSSWFMEKEMNEMEILNVPAFAELLGITEQSLYARRSRDPESLPPAIRIGRRLVWRRETIEEWLVDLKLENNGRRRRRTSVVVS